MSFSESIMQEFDNEMAITRRVLERVPDDRLTWKPHPKSGSFAWMAGHVANIPYWTAVALESESFDYAPPGAEPLVMPEPESAKQLLETFDTNVAKARAAIEKASDEEWSTPWTLLAGGKTIFTTPRSRVLRGMILSHLIHHRGELCVYLRLNDIPVPAVYGPSADEG